MLYALIKNIVMPFSTCIIFMYTYNLDETLKVLKPEEELELEEEEIYMEMDMLKLHSDEISDCLSVELGMLHSLHLYTNN